MSDVITQILDLARWAPSGDNTQPWRFEILGPDHIAVHGFDTRAWCVYDFNGHASHMAHGALLETLRIAATRFALRASWTLRPDAPDTAPVYDVRLTPAPSLWPDPLGDCITTRSVQRRPMRAQRLDASQKQALAEAVGPDFELLFFESLPARVKVASLLWRSAHIRLTCPEAYRTHKEVIEWGAQFSEDRIPEQAVGVDPMTAKLMRWVLQSWGRVSFFNRYLFGTVAPRVQLDLIPALKCSAHIMILPKRRPEDISAHVQAGAAMQRLWLTTAALGLHLQPEMTPVIFRWYARANIPISRLASINENAGNLAAMFERIVRTEADLPYSFFCRIGYSQPPKARSLRRSLAALSKGVASPHTMSFAEQTGRRNLLHARLSPHVKRLLFKFYPF